MRSATPDGQRLPYMGLWPASLLNPIWELNFLATFTERRREDGNLLLLRRSTNRLSLNRWFRKADISIASRFHESPHAKVSFSFTGLPGKPRNKHLVSSSWTSTRSPPYKPFRMTFPDLQATTRRENGALKVPVHATGKMTMRDYVQIG